jgi:hypothetical protein
MINYSPFHYIGNFGVSVGVAFTLDCWLFTIHISASIGATLTIQGPPFGGVAHVDFWVFGFNIYFGDQNDKPRGISLDQFYLLLLQQPIDSTPSSSQALLRGRPDQAKPVDSASVRDLPSPAPNDHVLAVVAGRFTGKQKDINTATDAAWVVRRHGFIFSVRSHFAIEKATYARDQSTECDTPNPIYAKPMLLLADTSQPPQPALDQHISSVLEVTVTKPGEQVGTFKVTAIVQNEPDALWGPC